jgi:sugar phosphate isomerase/epimerase
MKWPIGISTGACTHLPILDVLPAIADSGVTGVELGTPPKHFDPWHEDQVAALAKYFATGQLAPVSIHAPFGATLDLAADDPEHRYSAVAAIITTALAMKRVGGRMIVVHPSDLERNGGDGAARLRHCREVLRCHGTVAYEMTLVVESPLPLPSADILTSLAVCSTVLIQPLACASTRAFPRPPPAVVARLARLVHVHAHDNHGASMTTSPPGDGAIPY